MTRNPLDTHAMAASADRKAATAATETARALAASPEGEAYGAVWQAIGTAFADSSTCRVDAPSLCMAPCDKKFLAAATTGSPSVPLPFAPSHAEQYPDALFVAKPALGSHGDGVEVLRAGDVPAAQAARGDLVVQRYVEAPHLLGGRKYDLRLYAYINASAFSVAAAAVDGTAAAAAAPALFLYGDGIARFAGAAYAGTATSDRVAHLTNSRLQREADPAGYCAAAPMHTVKEVLAALRTERGDAAATKAWAGIRAAVTDVVSRTWSYAAAAALAGAPAPEVGSYVKLYGVDVILDGDLTPYVLELNCAASFAYLCEERVAVKNRMMDGLLGLMAGGGAVGWESLV